MSWRSQAVRLPKRSRFDCAEVEITRQGDAVVLRPRRTEPGTSVRTALSGFDAVAFADLFASGQEQPRPQERPALGSLFE
jgi:antitoxin VapB